jgi:hypothetical protein
LKERDNELAASGICKTNLSLNAQKKSNQSNSKTSLTRAFYGENCNGCEVHLRAMLEAATKDLFLLRMQEPFYKYPNSRCTLLYVMKQKNQ